MNFTQLVFKIKLYVLINKWSAEVIIYVAGNGN